MGGQRAFQGERRAWEKSVKPVEWSPFWAFPLSREAVRWKEEASFLTKALETLNALERDLDRQREAGAGFHWSHWKSPSLEEQGSETIITELLDCLGVGLREPLHQWRSEGMKAWTRVRAVDGKVGIAKVEWQLQLRIGCERQGRVWENRPRARVTHSVDSLNTFLGNDCKARFSFA